MFNFLNYLSHFSFKIAEKSAWSEERAVVSGSGLQDFLLHWLPLTRGQRRLAGYVWTSSLCKFCHGLCCMNTTFSFKHRRGSGKVLQISRHWMSETLLMFHGFQRSRATLVRPANNEDFCLCVSSSIWAQGSLHTLTSCSRVLPVGFYTDSKTFSLLWGIRIQKALVYKVQPFCPEKFLS